jgi:glucans biosynthesis protein
MVCLCVSVVAVLPPLAAGPPDFFLRVRQQAEEVSRQAYQPPTNRLPAALSNLNYVQEQAIQFRTNKALWASERLPFEIAFFLPGRAHAATVELDEVFDGTARSVRFDPSVFDFGTNHIELPPEVGYAGFRILHPAGFGEVASFLGASYFRMVGRGEAFGASARGLALNTVDLGKEEFPAFRHFWLEKPVASARALRLWALLDSPSVAGAFEFLITPGGTTVAEVKATFFPRREVKDFGVAPLSSMFFYDENSHVPFSDFRPEVHDSDGLLLETGQNRVMWRPLDTAKMMRVNAYQDVNPKGFGLMQRDRDFDHYQDLVARFELRPSVWVTPMGAWGPGSVQLIQLPTNIEYTDNAVAFWVPAQSPRPGQSLDVAYQLRWTTNLLVPASLGHVLSTRIGTVPATGRPRPNLRFVIDFGGPAMNGLSAQQQIDAEVNYGAEVKFIASTVVRNEINGTWRLVLEFTGPMKAVDLSAVLKRAGRPVTETWAYTFQP